MTSIEELKLEKILKQISLNENIINPVTKFIQQGQKGDGYGGLIKAIELIGSNKTIGLVLKEASNSDKLRKQSPIREAFITEIYFYKTIFPTFLKLQLEHKIKNPFISVPQCYETVSIPKEELLILENLKNKGYDMWNRKYTMNNEHIEFVMKEYGKFHGNSFALKQKNKELFQEIVSNLTDNFQIFWEECNGQKLISDISNKLKNAFDPTTEKNGYDKFVQFFDNLSKHYKDFMVTDEYAVITHGDCWCNNMMFRYKEHNQIEPESMRLIDFQITRLASPVMDLSYFFYVCASKPIMKNLNHYLKIYHDSLSEHLTQFEINPENIFSFKTLLTHWKNYSKFGFIMSLIVIKIMLSDSDEAPDLSAEAEINDDVFSVFNFKSRYEDEFRERIKDVFDHFCENNFI